ncbi:MAG: T9SS type A sorting domain-containing protein [Bacteroidota bacterium]
MRFSILILLFITNSVYSQKNDYIQVNGFWGDSSQSAFGRRYGLNIMDYSYNPVITNRDSGYMNFDWTNSSFSDDSGHLLFYTNGISIANKYNEKMENSDTLNPSYYSFVEAPDVFEYGYRLFQGTLVLPSLRNDSIYYLFHSTLDSIFTITDIKNAIKYLKLTTIDIAANGGNGKVISKNQRIWNGINYMGNINACKHGNGRDWWILERHRGDDCFSRSLVSPYGISSEQVQCIGSIQDVNDLNFNTFTSDGSKYIVSSYPYGGIAIYDFDRCSGLLSNERHIVIPFLRDSLWYLSTAVSANSKYLYVISTGVIYQYDLEASNIATSQIIIAQKDTITDTFFTNNYLSFGACFLGPDGKIYIGAGGIGWNVHLHVIENPDQGGLACNFRQLAYLLPAMQSGATAFSNNPNYRLGRLLGSPCDTLTGIESQRGNTLLKSIQIYPNPSIEYIRVDYGNIEWNSSTEPILSIYNMLGNEVYSSSLPAFSGIQDIDIKALSSGMYLIQIRKDAKLVATGKFVKE